MALPRLGGKGEKGDRGASGRGFKGTFQSWLRVGIGSQMEGKERVAELCQVPWAVTHAHVPDPALAKQTTPVNQLRGEELGGRGASRQGQRDGGQKDIPLPPLTTPSLQSRGFPRLRLSPASALGLPRARAS